MRTLLLAAALLAVVAWADPPPSATGVQLDQTVMKRFANCPATGSAAQVVVNGKYFMTINDEKTTVCVGTTCDGGNGTDFGSGFGMAITFFAADAGTPVACLSAGATGDLQLTKAK